MCEPVVGVAGKKKKKSRNKLQEEKEKEESHGDDVIDGG